MVWESGSTTIVKNADAAKISCNGIAAIIRSMVKYI